MHLIILKGLIFRYDSMNTLNIVLKTNIHIKIDLENLIRINLIKNSVKQTKMVLVEIKLFAFSAIVFVYGQQQSKKKF
jgi:hypothetical protein